MTAVSHESRDSHYRSRGVRTRLVTRARAGHAAKMPATPLRAAARSRVRVPHWLIMAVVVGDLLAVAAAWAASQAIFPTLEFSRVISGPSGAALAWPFLLAALGSYTAVGLAARDTGRNLVSAAILLVALFAVVGAALSEPVARTTVFVVAPLLVAISLSTRRLVTWRLRRLRRAGVGLRRVVAVGPGEAISELVDELATVTDHPNVVVAACTEGGVLTEDIPVARELRRVRDWDTGASDIPGGAAVEAVLDAVHRFDADSVCVVGSSVFAGQRLQVLSWSLRDYDVDLLSAPGLVDVASHRISFDRAGGVTLLHVRPVPTRSLPRVGKFVFDRVASALLLFFLALPMLAIAVGIRLTSRGPAIFKQTRLGKNGRPFTMLKFRSMVTDAEALLGDLLPANDHDGVLFKLREDPRVTPLGRLLRRSSLDELPQIINVLLGHMSLVGPRPPLPDEVAKYNRAEHRRLLARPGMTGLWQVSGRSTLNWDESVRFDLRYVDNWSLSGDLRLLGRTVSAVVRGTGAY